MMMEAAIIMNDINRYPYKQVISLGLVLLLVFIISLLPATVLADPLEGEITGIFSITTEPEVLGIEVYDAGAETVPQSLTPTQTYDIIVEVKNEGSIEQLEQVELLMWYDEDGESNPSDPGSYFWDHFPGAGERDGRDLIRFHWDGNLFGTQQYVEGTTHTWDIIRDDPDGSYGSYSKIIFNEEKYDGDLDEIETAKIKFTVTVGKVATHTDGEGSVWQIGARATSPGDLEDWRAYSAGENYGLPMDWYGEIEVPEDLDDPESPENYQVKWSDAHSGMGFDHPNAHRKVFFDEADKRLKFISNGTYVEQVKASEQWVNTENQDDVVNLVSGETVDAGQFALQLGINASPEPEYGDIAGDKVDILHADFAIASERGEQTQEDGDKIFDYHIFLKLGDGFTGGATYQGNIIFGITNNTES